MRLILTILLFSVKGYAATYYVSNTGSDAASGTSTINPWQTIAKVNSFALVPGDVVLFNQGDSWNEKLVPPSSGSAGNVITFGSYGTGAAPVITGFQTLTFSNQGSNIWAATFANSVPYQNTVYINGALRDKGRYPNAGANWLTFTSHTGRTQITGNLTGTPNYTGGEIVIRTRDWVMDKARITAQSGGTLTFGPGTWYDLQDNWGYFIQNIESVLDIQNEWCIDSTAKVVKVYATSQPTGKASSIDTLLYINKNYLTFNGITFEGANTATVQLNAASNITITNCTLNDGGGDAIKGKVASHYLTVSNCSINRHYNGAIFMDYTTTPDIAEHDYSIITGNTIKHIGAAEGMAKGAIDAGQGITHYGDHATISRNVIDTVGYIPLRFFGDTSLVEENVINYACFIKQDGGAIYTFNNGTYTTKYNQVVRKNIVMNLPGGAGGSLGGAKSVYAIYMDGPVKNVIVDSNTVYNSLSAGMIINSATDIKIRGNNFFNNKGTQILWIGYNPNLDGNMYVTDNVLYSGLAVPQYGFTPLVNAETYYIPFNKIGVIDSNYYLRPPLQTELIKWYNNGTPYSLPGWQTTSGLDANAKGLPIGIANNAPLIRYNTTPAAVVYPLDGTFINAKGQTFTGSVTVQPYRSELLFYSISQSQIGKKIGTLKFN